MVARIIYYLFLLVVLISSLLIFTSILNNKNSRRVKLKRNRLNDIKEKTIIKLDNKDIDDIFFYSGINIKAYTYKLARYIILGLWLLLLVAIYIFQRQFSLMQISLFILISLISAPRLTFAGKKTPFSFITDSLKKDYRDKKNKEVYMAICQLKNIATININNIGSDLVLEHLIKFTNITKPVFSRMLKMWYEYDLNKACDYFSQAIDTSEGNKLAEIFRKLDNLSPNDLKEQLNLYQSSFVADRKTAKDKKNENKGYFLYGSVIISALAVVFNFVIIVFILDVVLNISNF